MAFDVNTITVQGTIAVASATVGNKFVIDGCDATTDILTQAQAAQVAVRPANPGSTTSEISLAGSTDNHVFAYAEFLQGEATGGDFNTFYLYGHLQDMPDTVVVIAVASATATTHIPDAGDVTNRTEIQFDLTFSPNADVVKVADTSMYCTRGEFLILKERTVTTHKEGEPTTGEEQTIYGNKTFNGIVTAYEILPLYSSLGLGGVGRSDNRFPDGYFYDLDSAALTIGRTSSLSRTSFSTTNQNELEVVCKGPSVTIATTTDDLATYPLSYVKIARDYANGASFDILAQDSSTETDGKIRIHSGNSTADLKKLNMGTIKGTYGAYLNLAAGTDGNSNDACEFSVGITVGGTNQAYIAAKKLNGAYGIQLSAPSVFFSGDLLPDVGATRSIGSAYSKFKNGYINEITTTKISAPVGSDIDVDGSIIPFSGNAYSLGDSTSGFTDVYANNLHGVIPLPAEDSDSNIINVPIGGIVLAYHESYHAEQYVRPGYQFAIVDPAQAHWYTALSDGSGAFSQGTPLGTGTYKFLSDMSLASPGLGGVSLIIRIA